MGAVAHHLAVIATVVGSIRENNCVDFPGYKTKRHSTRNVSKNWAEYENTRELEHYKKAE